MRARALGSLINARNRGETTRFLERATALAASRSRATRDSVNKNPRMAQSAQIRGFPESRKAKDERLTGGGQQQRACNTYRLRRRRQRLYQVSCVASTKTVKRRRRRGRALREHPSCQAQQLRAASVYACRRKRRERGGGRVSAAAAAGRRHGFGCDEDAEKRRGLSA